MTEKKNKGLIFQFIMLMLLLVVSPVGTYFWMKGGFDYRKQRMEELSDFGRVGSFRGLDIDGSSFTTEDIAEKMVLVSFLPNDKSKAKSIVERVEMVEHQMEEQLAQRKDMLFLFYTQERDLLSYSEDLMTEENDKFEFISVDQVEYNRLLDKVYFLENATIPETERTLTLVDLSGNIRHYYDAMVNEDMGRLVEHMAMILPKAEEKDIIFKREKEK